MPEPDVFVTSCEIQNASQNGRLACCVLIGERVTARVSGVRRVDKTAVSVQFDRTVLRTILHCDVRPRTCGNR